MRKRGLAVFLAIMLPYFSMKICLFLANVILERTRHMDDHNKRAFTWMANVIKLFGFVFAILSLYVSGAYLLGILPF